MRVLSDKHGRAFDALEQPDRVRPGQIFVMDFGGGGFERTGRTIGSINKGFLDYSEA